jgi:hypothetical protein
MLFYTPKFLIVNSFVTERLLTERIPVNLMESRQKSFI